MPSNSKTPIARNGVFISYARSDGEEFSNVLRQRLEAEEIQLWQDRVGMEGGRDWWLQITEALDQVEFMALVITPNAVKSDTVRKEWRYARQQGVCVYPIKGTPDLDFNSLPRWMRSAHFYDLEREWQKFVNDLNTRCQMRRVPFMVGDLPEGFVERPDEFDRLLKLLCDEGREEPVAITAALRGAGGYGKTTLAKALCHDERIQDAFDDGILWVTLGENPGDLTGRVEDLIVTLGDDRPGFTALDAAVNRFKELIADRDILIVIDDVWDRSHLNPFIQGGLRCARLVTTRDLATLPVTAEKVRVDAMQQDEATALLAAGLDQVLLQDRGLSRELKELASRLGEWPLLLRLANSALRNRVENDKQPPRDAVNWVNKALAKRGLTYFDASNSDERHQAVAKTIGVSLDLLTAKERERYNELAIFPEDVEIPLATLEKLWAKTGAFDEFDTEGLCTRLNRLSLLWSYDANSRRIRLHDVVRKFLIEQQGNKLSEIHAQLLGAHSTGSCLWAEMSDEEPYLWDHLAHHLTEANHGEDLVATAKDWRYLVSKTLKRKSLAVEADLLMAEKTATQDDSFRLLRQNFANFGHVLNRCENRDDLEATLFSRLKDLDGLKAMTIDLEQHLKRPYVMPTSKLPDLSHPALVRTLIGHAGWVNACAMSADGATVVSASGDRTLKVWDARRGAERFTLTGHTGGVSGCAVTADASMIVSASEDGTLKIWDGNSGAERFTLRGHTAGVTACAVNADGSIILSASWDRTLRSWDGQTGEERFTLKGHEAAVLGCTISADGAMIVSASSDKTLKVWDAQTGNERFTLIGHTAGVNGCAVNADGSMIVSASADETVKVWDGKSGKERLTLSGHTGVVKACAVSADASTIASASWDQTLKVWDGTTGLERFTLGTPATLVIGCAVSANGEMIVSASTNHTLKVWDARIKVERSTHSGHNGPVFGCAITANGKIVVSASWDKTLKVWDGEIGTERLTLSGHIDAVSDCAVSADGETIVSISQENRLKVWDGRTGKARITLNNRGRWGGGCAISADGTMIVSGSEDKMLNVWDGLSGDELFTLRGHQGGVDGCSISADGKVIVSASEDKTIKVWDVRTGVERLTMKGHADLMNCAISADGLTIVSASTDRTLKVWNAENGSERFTLCGHTDIVRGCALSADGSTIISTSEDQTLKVWDGRIGNCISTFHADGALFACACSADGEIIVAGGAWGVYFLRLIR